GAIFRQSATARLQRAKCRSGHDMDNTVRLSDGLSVLPLVCWASCSRALGLADEAIERCTAQLGGWSSHALLLESVLEHDSLNYGLLLTCRCRRHCNYDCTQLSLHCLRQVCLRLLRAG